MQQITRYIDFFQVVYAIYGLPVIMYCQNLHLLYAQCVFVLGDGYGKQDFILKDYQFT